LVWTTVGSAALVVLILYCTAKRRGGLDVFLSGAIPGGVSGLSHDLFGTPRWLGLVLVPVALLMIASNERAREKA
jgi:hypothetical protein